MVKRRVTQKRSRVSTKKTVRVVRTTARTPRRAQTRAKLVLKTPARRTYLGVVTHYYTTLRVGVVRLAAPVQQGDPVSFEGPSTAFRQKMESMHLDHAPVKEAHAGQAIGVRVRDRVREGDKVFLD